MRPKPWVLFPLIATLLCFTAFSGAQNWSGILDSSRAVDWSNAGIAGGIPVRTTVCSTSACNTLNGGTVTTASINAAIASASANQVVTIPAGSYTITAGINFNANSNVTLRGAGPTQTILNFTHPDGCSGITADVCFINAMHLYDGHPWVQPGQSNAALWTGGYAQGTTQITLTNVGSNTPTVGTLLLLDQANDIVRGAGLTQCDTIGVCSQNGGAFGRIVSGVTRSQIQIVKITAINGSTYTITPGLYANNWRGSQLPGAWWSGIPISGVGIENLTLDHTSSSTTSGVEFYDCYQCWMKNVRSIRSGRDHVYITQSSQVVIRDSYFFGNQSGGGTESYGVEPSETSDDLIENNIFEQISSPIVSSQGSGVVIGYNFSWNNVFSNPAFMQVSYPSHDAGNHMNLFEGNYFNGISSDTAHGGSPLTTLFRNWIPGQQPPPNSKSVGTESLEIEPLSRAWNVIGNVLGTAGTHNNYESSPATGTANCNTSIYLLGWSSYQCSPSGSIGNDSLVASTMMRWGNYDTVHGSVQWNSAEVPTSGITFVSGNPVPSSHNLPNSFYYGSRPSWYQSSFGTPPWPPIGPDVTGGQGPGGFAYENPAYLCYANGTFSGGILNFDADNCYGGGTPPPAPPTNLGAQVK